MPRPVVAVWSDACLAHEPDGEVWVGVRIDGTEVPERAVRIRAALQAAGIPEATAAAAPRALLEAVHEPALLDHLRDVRGQWDDAGYPTDPGQDRVVPYVFPTEGLLGGLPARVPTAVHARAGLYCYDTMTLVGPGTWEAAVAAAGASATAAGLAADTGGIAYAVARPPGHHATRSAYGGSCYLNNAAVAAEALRRLGAERVAVIDIDAHHGNGTASIFYDRADVLVASAHVDPGAGWFPHYVGFADETGRGDGDGATLNVPLAPGTGDDGWLAAVERLTAAAAAHGAEALVVSLGVDAAAADPESPLQVSEEGYRAAGALLGGLGLPTAVVQEGGYHLPSLGGLVVAALQGMAGSGA